MHDPLAPLLADGVIDEILTRLKSGKEAELWLVRHGQEIVAAKVYKERLTRSFKNDAAYREGRQVRNSRTQRAMDKGSRFGQHAAEEAWKAKEADALHTLHAAGVRVPRPVIFYEGVLLMELVLDPFGHPAPRLVDAHVTREHAAALYEDLRSQAVKMLCCDLIHGDFSAYNILAGRDGPVVIDFPQVVGAAHNSQSERFFQRDLDNLLRFFQPLDPSLRARAGDAREIWRAYLRRELTPDFVPTGRHVEPVRQGRSEPGRAPQGRPHGERPHADRPHGERPHADRPHGERPRTGRQPGDHGRGGPPPGDRPRLDRPRENRPPGDRPKAERPRGDRPRGDPPRGDRPRQERPQGDRPPHGPRPDHHDRRDRREQRDARERTDRRDPRERSGPPRPPVGAGHSAPQPEVVRVNRPPPRPGNPTGQGPAHGQGKGAGQGPQGPGGHVPRAGHRRRRR
jgi:RIO kinase 1